MKEFDHQKSNDLVVIKGQMVNVISSLQSRHQLDEIMPLLNLLKTLENYINSSNCQDQVNCGYLNINEMKLNFGRETIGVTEKISLLFSRIHIESAYLESIKKSLVFGMKNSYKRKDIKNFLQQKTCAMEKKRLFILTLKLILRDNKSINTTDMNLDFLTTMLLENMESGIGNLISLIKDSCNICGPRIQETPDNKSNPNTSVTSSKWRSDQFCFCKMVTTDLIKLPHFSGVFNFKLYGFMGIYEADYLDKILTQNAPGLVADQFNQDCAGRQNKRRAVVIVKDQYVYSSWTYQSLTVSGHISMIKAREIEIQVWEAGSKSEGKHDRIVAVAIVPLQSLLVQKADDNVKNNINSKPITISLEPAGFVMCQVTFDVATMAMNGVHGLQSMTNNYNDNSNGNNKENCAAVASNVYKKFRLERRPNIFAKLGGYRVARYTEARVPVSVWTDWFQNHIDRLAVPVETKTDQTYIDIQKQETIDIHHQDFVNTSLSDSKNQKAAETIRNQSSSINLSKISTPKLNHVTPRPVCKFIQFDKESYAESRVSFSVSFANALRSQMASTPILDKFRKPQNLHSEVLSSKGFVRKSPEKSLRMTPIKTIGRRRLVSDIIENDGENSYDQDCLHAEMGKSLSQSNIELTNTTQHPLKCSCQLKRTQSLVSSNSDDDEDEENDHNDNNEISIRGENRFRFDIDSLKKFQRSYRKDVSILSKSLLECSMSIGRSRNVLPLACSPELQNIPVCKIDSMSKIHCNDDQSFYKPKQLTNQTCQSLRSYADESCQNQMKSLSNESKSYKMKEKVIHDWGSSYYDQSSWSNPNLTTSSFQKLNDTTVEERSDKSFWDENEDEDKDHFRLWKKEGKADKLSSNDFELLCVLGQGNFGKVLLARDHRKGTLCALKSIQKCRASKGGEYLSLQSEKKILTLIKESNHPFLIGLIGCFQTERYLLIAMDYAAGGDLMGHIHNNLFKEEDARFYVGCVVLAFEFLHNHDIVYRDLKLENILMDEQGYAKLTDFGLSKGDMKWNEYTTTFCGTPEFLAPEIISVQKYTRAVDWWALGVLVYQMVLGETPFPGNEDEEIFHNIMETFPDMSGLSPETLSFVTELLEHKPAERLGFGEHGSQAVKSHAFFKNIDWEKLYDRKIKCPFIPRLNKPTDTKYFESEFTSLAVSIEHDHPSDDKKINNKLFLDFDTVYE